MFKKLFPPSFKNNVAWVQIDNKIAELFEKDIMVSTNQPDLNLHFLFILIDTELKNYYRNYTDTFMDIDDKQKLSTTNYLDYMANNLTKNINIYTIDTNNIANDFCHYFKSQFNKTIQPPDKYIDWDVGHKIDTPFNQNNIELKELESIISLSSSNNTDSYGMSYNILKRIPKVHKYICEMYSKILANPDISSRWTKFSISPKYKNGNPMNISNYRAIIKFPIYVRIYNRLIARRILEFVKNNNMIDTDIQKGNDISNGVFNNVLKCRHILQDARLNGKPVVITFLDIKNAYGSITHDFLLYILKIYNLPENIVKYIHNLYTNAELHVKYNGQTSGTFKTNIGLHQGCALANIIFILIMNLFIKRIREMYPQCGYIQNENTIRTLMLAFVDDFNIITDNITQNEVICSMLFKMMAQCNMFINFNKACFISENISSSFINIYGNNIYHISSQGYRYLGSNINTTDDKEFIQYIEHYLKQLNSLDDKNMCNKAKCEIYRKYILKRLVWDMQLVLWFESRMNIITSIEYAFLKKWKYANPSSFLLKRNHCILSNIIHKKLKHVAHNKDDAGSIFESIFHNLTPAQIEKYDKPVDYQYAEYEYSKVVV